MVVSYGANLIANGNSELGALALGMIPEGLGLVNEPSNAFAGQWLIVDGAIQAKIPSPRTR